MLYYNYANVGCKCGFSHWNCPGKISGSIIRGFESYCLLARWPGERVEVLLARRGSGGMSETAALRQVQHCSTCDRTSCIQAKQLGSLMKWIREEPVSEKHYDTMMILCRLNRTYYELGNICLCLFIIRCVCLAKRFRTAQRIIYKTGGSFYG
jgi:hypothetical protein